jgi:hypothetical protein
MSNPQQLTPPRRGRKPHLDWPLYVVAWLDELARTDPERLHGCSIVKLAYAAMDHLQEEAIGWAPQDHRKVCTVITTWLKGPGS